MLSVLNKDSSEESRVDSIFIITVRICKKSRNIEWYSTKTSSRCCGYFVTVITRDDTRIGYV